MSLNTSKLFQSSSGASIVRLCGMKQISRPRVDQSMSTGRHEHERMDQTKLRTRARIASAGLCRLWVVPRHRARRDGVHNDDPELCLPFPAAPYQQ
jgi:hypothetical protein